MKINFWLVDAFTDQPFKGNPAAVMLVDDFPSDQICQKIAQEIHYSETAFVKPIKYEQFQLRWFSPKVEVDFCGHATLAAAHVLLHENIVQDQELHFITKSGPLRVTKADDNLLLLNLPLQKEEEDVDLKIFKSILEVPVLKAVRVINDVIVEIPEDINLQSLHVDIKRLEDTKFRGIIITQKSKGDFDFISRFFVPNESITEDPVTGSAHCKLADYWMHKLKKTEFKAYQASSRGGVIDIEVQGNRVLLKSQATILMRGSWIANT